ncbi:MAG: IclR family transcriptional regulator [Nocardia sp.]|uniref:IclR family transcriptional regulator n=1 Tax=Nocardia sp. TaxID=1821 RepID=UPI0026060DAA|nr:IclR family transcriptional regulator [Nocardia sp.]MCU1639963.1 IclR family transcriptional regulator [Nocardia sp.]
MGRTATGESVLSRAVRILETFTPEEPILQVSQIAARSGLHRATASRLIAELVEHGLLTREADRRLRIGVRVWELGLRASVAQSLREVSLPYMRSAHSVIGHQVQLGIRDRDDVIWLERLSALGAVTDATRVGGRAPLPVSSAGLVLLAFGPRELQERVLAERSSPFGPKTVAESNQLRRSVAEVRKRGFAWRRGDTREETCSVAVPVRNAEGTVVAALAALFPSDEERKLVAARVLLTAARGITSAPRRRPVDY